ncbi:MAG: transcription termination/antitermination protein NusG [Deltaproteobacteria bacterium]|nr:transcription termination/antitermination protein NusG [Deltaproteobacteria bacterium]MBW1958486.1 transcription termination/antitermination protein NusG [Deltaproteobacteria bacterium]MBW2013440.1 transcription termination/antitermination protein NusG [Deltaproteobacteria bacterium]MBW2088831.1 transcription termination/antitermination protein NusG [Deltaproteobacteria bacterium]MBW2319590.1 transcription termination/antitermination protein NusG [Deltaproteobacteria bacterium]
MALKWYIVHVYSGFESKVKAALEERVASFSQTDKFGEILVPTEEIVELVKGKRKTSSRKFYPGYILVRMELDDETWHIVNNTAKVTGFLGGREKPTPISDEEAERILNRMEAGKLKPQPKYLFEIGDEIRVIDGPFKNFNGTVDEVNPEKGKIRVLVSIFGRSTPVELEFVQVTKL